MRVSSSLLVALGLIASADAFVPRSIPAFATRSLAASSSADRTKISSALHVVANPALTNGDVTASSIKDTTVAAVPKVAQRWRKSTKQLVTLGPASSTREMIEKLFLAGADVFRLNFSHGSQEQKKELLTIIREIEEKYGHPIGILGDLQGPKLRVRTYTFTFVL
jgi:pyruvate kinase